MKRALSIFILLAVMAALFTGCQSSAAPNTTAGTTSTTPASNIKPSPSIDTATVAVTGTVGTITGEEAQAIALQHAGLTADKVTRLHTEPDLHDRIPHYDVEFHDSGYEYDYEIDAYTGEILKSEKERD